MTDNSPEEVSIDVAIYAPNRLMRRKIAGSPCGFCGLRMWMTEIVAIQQGDLPADYAHPACLEMNLQRSPEREGETDQDSTPKEQE